MTAVDFTQDSMTGISLDWPFNGIFVIFDWVFGQILLGLNLECVNVFLREKRGVYGIFIIDLGEYVFFGVVIDA